jgi:hypothetical protein
MQREILPPWSEYRKTLGVEDKEEPMTFGWLNDTCLAQTYTAENDWDDWVLATKDKERRKISRYDERQIHQSDYDEFLSSSATNTTLCDTFRAKFKVRYTDERLLEVMRAIKCEKVEELAVKENIEAEKRLADDIEILTLLYRSPIRWFLNPHTVVVSGEHIIRMQSDYPDYAEHIDTVKSALAEWNKKPFPETMPGAVFFRVFDAPDISVEEIKAMSKIYPDYAEDIESIKRTREVQMKEYLLGKMFIIKPVSAAVAAQEKADKAWRIFNEAKREAEKAQREAEVAMVEAEAAKRTAMLVNA